MRRRREHGRERAGGSGRAAGSKAAPARTLAWLAVVVAVCGQPAAGHAETRTLTLADVIALAQSTSPAAALAGHRYQANYWQYRNSRTAFLPVLTLDGTAPDLTRSISRLSLPDGSEAFVSRSFATSAAQLSLRKTIGTTGGEIFMQSSMDRIDLLEGERSTTYLSRPLSIGLRQPLFAFNPYPWQGQIEPMRFEGARRTYAEELEGIAIVAASSFFDVLSVQDRLDNARANEASADTVYESTRRRHVARRVSDDELSRAELAALNARLETMRAEIDAESRTRRLHAFLGVPDTVTLRLEITYDVPDLVVPVDRALSLARQNRSEWVEFDRRLIEASRDLAEARSERRVRMNLFANYGFSQTTDDPHELFRRGQETQQASVGIEVPLLDWGRWESRASLAESNWSVARITVERSRQDFEQDVLIKVNEFNVQRERIRIAMRADALAQQHFDAARRRYVDGEGSLTDLNLAQGEKDFARRGLVEALRGYWTTYHELRRATLHDFATERSLARPDTRPGD